MTNIIMDILTFIAIFCLGLFLKNYFPSYMAEKGKNLATKEDIQEIVRKTEEVQEEFKQDFERFSIEHNFKNRFYFEQYSELYVELYAIIRQSEYSKYFVEITQGVKSEFNKFPLIEWTPKETIKANMDLHTMVPKISKTYTDTALSQNNKAQLCNLIVERKKYSSEELLSLVMSYRVAHHFYSGNTEFNNSGSYVEKADDEELRLLREIIIRIVKDYNFFRKELQLEYNKMELETGIPKKFN